MNDFDICFLGFIFGFTFTILTLSYGHMENETEND